MATEHYNNTEMFTGLWVLSPCHCSDLSPWLDLLTLTWSSRCRVGASSSSPVTRLWPRRSPSGCSARRACCGPGTWSTTRRERPSRRPSTPSQRMWWAGFTWVLGMWGFGVARWTDVWGKISTYFMLPSMQWCSCKSCRGIPWCTIHSKYYVSRNRT